MPTYDYQCAGCGHRFEKFQPITAGPIRRCPKCGRPKVRRLIGPGAGVIFKGSGFYSTDYRSKSYSQDAEKDKTPSKGDDRPAGDKGGKEKDPSSKSDSANESSS